MSAPPSGPAGVFEPFPPEPPAGFERRWFRAGGLRLAIDRPPLDGTSTPAAGDADAAAASTGGAGNAERTGHGGDSEDTATEANADGGTAADEEADAILRFHDAVLLDEHGVLLDGLAEWLGEESDWRPDGTCDGPLDATLRSDGDGRRIGIGFDGEARLAALGGLPPPWCGTLSLLRHRLAAELVIDRFALGAEDLARWAAGSVVLLPNSFRAGWEAVLSAPMEPAVVAEAPPAAAAAADATSAPANGGGTIGDEARAIGDAPPVAARARAVLEEPFDVETARLGLDPLESLSPAAADALGSLDGRRGRIRLSVDGDECVSSASGTFARFGEGLAFVMESPCEGANAGTDTA